MSNRPNTAVMVYGNAYEVNERATLDDIEQAEPLFFKTKFGKRETYTMYRGCLIVRHTVTFTNCHPERRTVPYLFGYFHPEGCKGTFCMSHDCKNAKDARDMIDSVLDSGILRT